MAASNENKMKHLEFIQLTITRMNVNSFVVKGWLMTLVAAIYVLSAKDANTRFLWFAPLTGCLFWLLDTFFVCTERKFRSLYNHVRQLPEEQIDYSMDVTPYKAGRNAYLRCMGSLTLLLFYPAVIVASIMASVIM